jgi:hypothetical protein
MVETHPEKSLIGYARVSTYGQTLDSQLDQLRAAGCGSRNIYREQVTGARADRRELNRHGPSGGARRVLRCKNWRAATMSAARRFRG